MGAKNTFSQTAFTENFKKVQEFFEQQLIAVGLGKDQIEARVSLAPIENDFG